MLYKPPVVTDIKIDTSLTTDSKMVVGWTDPAPEYTDSPLDYKLYSQLTSGGNSWELVTKEFT